MLCCPVAEAGQTHTPHTPEASGWNRAPFVGDHETAHGGPRYFRSLARGAGVTLAAVMQRVPGQQEVRSEWTVDRVEVPWDGERTEGVRGQPPAELLMAKVWPVGL